MRTNIVLNDALFHEARAYSSRQSKKDVIEEALRVYVAVKERERRLRSYAERVVEVEQKTQELALRERPSSLLRDMRERR